MHRDGNGRAHTTNLDTYAYSDSQRGRYTQEFSDHQAAMAAAEADNIPPLCRNGRFWVISSCALVSFILAVLLLSLARPPQCPDACRTEVCSYWTYDQSGERVNKNEPCTCHTTVGSDFCSEKEQSVQDKSLTSAAVLFFILFFVIVVLSCAFTRCSSDYDHRRVGIDNTSLHLSHPTPARITIQQHTSVYHTQPMGSTHGQDHDPEHSMDYIHALVEVHHHRIQSTGGLFDQLPVATISRKPNVPVAVAIAV